MGQLGSVSAPRKKWAAFKRKRPGESNACGKWTGSDIRPPPISDGYGGWRFRNRAAGRERLQSALAADESVRWVSPRGTIEVLDDYPYWVAKKYGYFGDIQTTLEPGPSDATATVKLVDQKQADMGYPSPGVFSLGLEQGIPLVSVFHMGGSDVFDFAFRNGEKPKSVKGLEGKTILLGSAGWQSICDPMLYAAGVDVKTIKYVEAGWPTWGTALKAGKGDAALCWEGLRAQWKGQGLDFDYILGKDYSKLPANSFVIRKADFEDPSKQKLYARYLQGWAAGLEFGKNNPRAATQIVMTQFPGLASQMNSDGRHGVDDAACERLRRSNG